MLNGGVKLKKKGKMSNKSPATMEFIMTFMVKR